MKAPERIDLNLEQVDDLLKRVESGCLQAGDYQLIKAMVETIELLSQCVDEKAPSIRRLLRMLFGPRTEKLKNVIKDEQKKKPGSSKSGQKIRRIKATSQNQKDTAETQRPTIAQQSRSKGLGSRVGVKSTFDF